MDQHVLDKNIIHFEEEKATAFANRSGNNLVICCIVANHQIGQGNSGSLCHTDAAALDFHPASNG